MGCTDCIFKEDNTFPEIKVCHQNRQNCLFLFLTCIETLKLSLSVQGGSYPYLRVGSKEKLCFRGFCSDSTFSIMSCCFHFAGTCWFRNDKLLCRRCPRCLWLISQMLVMVRGTISVTHVSPKWEIYLSRSQFFRYVSLLDYATLYEVLALHSKSGYKIWFLYCIIFLF